MRPLRSTQLLHLSPQLLGLSPGLVRVSARLVCLFARLFCLGVCLCLHVPVSQYAPPRASSAPSLHARAQVEGAREKNRPGQAVEEPCTRVGERHVAGAERNALRAKCLSALSHRPLVPATRHAPPPPPCSSAREQALAPATQNFPGEIYRYLDRVAGELVLDASACRV